MGAPVRQGERKGDFLAGKYLVGDCLGVGGMGEVYRAQNMSLGRNVAVKILNRDYVKNEDDVLRFLREARAAAAVRHPNVVDVLDVARDDDGTPFIVQELLVGEDLESYLRARGGRLKQQEALDILIPIADAIASAHARDVIHRDLKPANIFLARDGARTTPKVLDFGACLFPTLGGLSRNELRMLIGTPHYMAPEQIVGKSEVDARTDVWALGVILYELLAGQTPFEAESGSAVLQLVKTREVPKLSIAVKGTHDAVAELVADCMQRDRSKRIASGEEVLARMKAAREALRRAEVKVDTQPEILLSDIPAILGGTAAIPDLALPPKPTPDLELPKAPRRSQKLLTLSEPDALDEPSGEPGKKESLIVPPASTGRERAAAVTKASSSPPGHGDGLRDFELPEDGGAPDLRLAAEPAWRSSKPPERPSHSLPPILEPGRGAPSQPPPPTNTSSSARTAGAIGAVNEPPPISAPTPPRSASAGQMAAAPPAAEPKAAASVRQPSSAKSTVRTSENTENTAGPTPASTGALAKLAAVVILPAVACFFAFRLVPSVTAPLGRALRGDTTVASGALAVVTLVLAAVLSWRALYGGSRDRLLLATVVGSWATGIVMIVQTFAASENEHGMTPTGLGAAPFVAPLAALAGAYALAVRAHAAWNEGEKRERIVYPLLASLFVFLALELSPIGAALLR